LRPGGPRIAEDEGSVLVAGAAGNGIDVDLIAVVFARVFKRDAEFEGVIVPDLGEVVATGPDGSGGMRGIGSARKREEIWHAGGWDFIGDVLASGEDVGERDGHGQILAVEAGRRCVDGNVDVVDAQSDARLIQQGRGDGGRQGYRVGLVGTMEESRGESRILIEGQKLGVRQIPRRAESRFLSLIIMSIFTSPLR